MDRRKLIAAAVALPCIGVAGSATATPGNATDAAWSAYEDAKAAHKSASQLFHSISDALPAHLCTDARPLYSTTNLGGARLYSVDAIKRHSATDPLRDLRGRPAYWERVIAEFTERRAAYDAGRAEHGADAAGEAADEMCDRLIDAERAMLDAPIATLTDLERKLTIVSGWNGELAIPAETADAMLAGVRLLLGVAS